MSAVQSAVLSSRPSLRTACRSTDPCCHPAPAAASAESAGPPRWSRPAPAVEQQAPESDAQPPPERARTFRYLTQ